MNEKTGTSTGNFLKIDPNAYFSGLGNTGTGAAKGIYSSYNNPAGLIYTNNYEILFSHSSIFDDIKINNISFGSRYKLLNYALNIIYCDKGDIYLADYNSGINGYYGKSSSKDMNIMASFNLFSQGIYWGLNLKYIKLELADEKARTVTIDFGILKKVNRNLSLGFVIKNLDDKKVHFVSINEKLPLEYRFGLHYILINNNLNLYCDFVKPRDNSFQLKSGIEYNLIQKILSLRLGYDSSYDDGDNMTFGVGIKYNKFEFDYSYSPFTYFDDIHKMSMKLKLGKPSMKRPDITKKQRPPWPPLPEKKHKKTVRQINKKIKIKKDKVTEQPPVKSVEEKIDSISDIDKLLQEFESLTKKTEQLKKNLNIK